MQTFCFIFGPTNTQSQEFWNKLPFRHALSTAAIPPANVAACDWYSIHVVFATGLRLHVLMLLWAVNYNYCVNLEYNWGIHIRLWYSVFISLWFDRASFEISSELRTVAHSYWSTVPSMTFRPNINAQLFSLPCKCRFKDLCHKMRATTDRFNKIRTGS